jgi:hypothetical protein
MSSNKQKTQWWIIIAFVIVPIIVSVISTIHVISFFELSNYYALSLVLAIAFELGALSSLAGLVAMDKISKGTVWLIFVLLTAFQMMGNTYYAYDTTSNKMIFDSNLIKNFTELFGFNVYDESDVIFVKRVIAVLSGAILPIISLSFLHLLVNYISNSNPTMEVISKESDEDSKKKTDLESKPSVLEDKIEDFPIVAPPITPVSVPAIEEIKTPEQPQVEPIVKEESFDEFLDKKKKKLEEDRKNYSELLDVLFKGGTIKKGEELPSYNEFIKMIDPNKYPSDVVKVFLTLSNYLDVSKVSGEHKIALMEYEEAKSALENYLSFNS